jgi:hypothetical protein
MPHRLCLVLTFLVLIAPVRAEETANFLLVRNLRGLTILDRFQQQLSPTALKSLGANVPFRVVKLNETLGDELTQAHRVLYQGEPYLLVLNSAGELPGEPGNVDTLKKCVVLDDTIRVRQDRALKLLETAKKQASGVAVQKDDRLVRRFKYKDFYYLRRAGARPLSGWSLLKPESAWELVKAVAQTPEKSGLGTLLIDRIHGRISQVNTSYRQYFGHFNSQAGRARIVPSWECRPVGDGLECVWHGDPETFRGLTASTGVLVKDLENILLGKPFAVVLKNMIIAIQPEEQR